MKKISEIDPENNEALDEFNREMVKRAGRRIRAAVKKLRANGIIDNEGSRIKKDLPPDMKG
jgi:hypothetical protein